jgi:outer membrane receptor for ferrienterochelin and colicins
MQKIYLVAAILLFSALSASAQNAVLRGVITQKESLQPLPGANIYFDGTTIGTATNNQGVFQIKRITPGSYDLIISFSGFKRIKKNITLKSGENILNFEMEESKNNLGEVVITGTGTAHHLKTAPVPTELISKKAIMSAAPANFNDLMMTLSPSYDSNPGNMGSFMKINGLDNNFIVVLIDGKRMYGDIGGNNDLNRINPDNVERIEIVKGASSLLYGSDAIAGVVNIITKKSKQKLSISNSSRVRNYNTFQQNNTIDLNFGKLLSHTSFSKKRSDGWQLSTNEINRKGKLVATNAKAQAAYKDYTIEQTLTFNATKKLQFNVGGSYYQKEISIPVTVKKYGYYFNDITYSTGAKYKLNKTDYLSADYHHDQFRYYYRYNQKYKDFTNGDKAINNDQRLNNLRIKYVSAISNKNRLTLGIDYLNEKMVSEKRLVDGKAEANTIAAYTQDEITLFQNLNLVAGIRWVKHNKFGNALTPKVSVLYKLKNFSLRGTYGLGYKAPTVKELYFHYEKRKTLYLGNSNLNPQKSNYASVGIDFNNSVVSISISGYQNNVNDLIAYKTVKSEPEDKANKIKRRRQHFNLEKAKTEGVDFLFNIIIGGGFTVGGGYSYVDAKDITNNSRLEGVANNYGNVRCSYNKNWNKYKLNVNILGRIQDEKFYDDGNAKAYNIWKFTTNHKFTNLGNFILNLSAGVDNIFDFVDNSPYGSHYGTLSPGRTFFVGVNINFSK